MQNRGALKTQTPRCAAQQVFYYSNDRQLDTKHRLLAILPLREQSCEHAHTQPHWRWQPMLMQRIPTDFYLCMLNSTVGEALPSIVWPGPAGRRRARMEMGGNVGKGDRLGRWEALARDWPADCYSIWQGKWIMSVPVSCLTETLSVVVSLSFSTLYLSFSHIHTSTWMTVIF